MDFNLEQSLTLLESTPSTFTSLLRNLPDAWTASREGESSWNASDVLAHLAQCEATDWMPRVRTILEFGDRKAFEPLDREAFRKTSLGKPLPLLLDEFARLRSQNLLELRGLHLGSDELQLQGRHPAFGPVAMSQLLAAWTVHDLTHLHQISRILAVQYQDAVGPWSKYLGVLHCNGHSQA
jgi:hypothetical protein